jgi:RimJ/RimL family protein N-acetyltransferase
MHRPEPLVAIVEPANTRSVRVLQNIGMSRSGTYPYLDRVWDLYVPEPHHDIPRAHDAAGQSGA